VTFNYHVRLLNPEVLNLHERLILLRDGMLWPEPSPGRSLRERPRVLAHKGAKAGPSLFCPSKGILLPIMPQHSTISGGGVFISESPRSKVHRPRSGKRVL